MNILKLYDEEIKKTNGNVIAIMLVGSHMYQQKGEGKDIDLFVILDEGSSQTRRIKTINGVELDINYFPLTLARSLIDKGEYFFIYELAVRASVLQDSDEIAEDLIKKARAKYEQGPKLLDKENICLMRHEADSLIQRTKMETDIVQRNINALSCLSKLLKAYFEVRGIWCPKEKHIVKAVQENDVALYDMAKEFVISMDTGILDKISKRVFHNICVPDELTIEY